MSSLSTRAGLGDQPLFTLTAGGGEGFRVVRFKAREALSGLFEVHVELAGPEVELTDVIDTPMTLNIASTDAPRHISGICASFEYIGETRRYQLYEAVIVPWLWRLQFRRNSRIFQDMSTPDIVQKVLTGAGLLAETRLLSWALVGIIVLVAVIQAAAANKKQAAAGRLSKA